MIGLVLFLSQPIDHGWWLAAKSGMRTLLVVKLDPFLNARFCIRSGLPDVQVDAFEFQRPPEPLDKDVIKEAALSQQVFPASSCKDREATTSASRELISTVTSRLRSKSVLQRETDWLCPNPAEDSP